MNSTDQPVPQTTRRRLNPAAWGLALWAGLLLALPTTASAQWERWVADPDHTRVHWEVRHFGTSTSRGRFDDVKVELRLNRQTGQGEVWASIGTGSVSTGVPMLDRVLRGADYFDSAAHPRADYVSRRFRFDGHQLRQLDGELTLRDRSIPLSLRALHFHCRPATPSANATPPPAPAAEVCGGDFEAVLRRTDLDITHGLPFVANRVRLLIQIEAVNVPPP